MQARTTVCALALLLVLTVVLGAEGTDSPGIEPRVDRYLQPYLDIGHLSGTLLVSRGDEVLYEKSFGLANREHDLPNTARTRFCVGSINKPMTIVILARLLEAQKLALTDTLAKFLPDFPRAGEITVGDLLNHSAGIPHRVTEPLDETRPQTPVSMVELASRKPLVFEPGSDSVYSSAGFSVLARVLELAGGKPYAELLTEHVLRPAGMADTFDVGTRGILEHRAASYVFDTDGLLNARPTDISYLVGAGSVYSTPGDLLAMQRALLAGKLGKLAQQMPVRESGNLRWNGSVYGFRAFADYDAASGISVVMASNLTSGAAAEVDQKLLKSYEGAYELRPGRSLELRVVDGRVRMNEWLLIPTSDTMFFSPQDYAEIKVVLDENGAISRLDWTTGGETYPMPKVDVSKDE